MGYAVFPSLARGISWGSSQKIEDGTIRDKMEMGQVMTRQRFSRLRRTWKIEYQFLNSTDMTAIDFFYRTAVQGGALPFYWPNLLENGGFEYNTDGPAVGTPSLSVLCDGWFVSPGGAAFTAKLVAGVAQSGTNCLQLDGIPSYNLAAHGNVNLSVLSNTVPVKAGQTIQVSGAVNVPLGSLPTGASFMVRVGLVFISVLNAGISGTYPPDTTAPTTQYGWTQVSTQAVAPAGTVKAHVQCAVFLVNSTGAAIAMPSSAYLTAEFDNLGLALVSPVATYGNMPSNGPIPVAVRFPKPIEIMDSGWINNGPSYRVQFELEEV